MQCDSVDNMDELCRRGSMILHDRYVRLKDLIFVRGIRDSQRLAKIRCAGGRALPDKMSDRYKSPKLSPNFILNPSETSAATLHSLTVATFLFYLRSPKSLVAGLDGR